MTQDEIIRMAREAGFEYAVDNERWYRFAALVAAHERDACAKVCEENKWGRGGWCAKAIRARSN